jgi:hypothetical protein
MLVLTMNTNEGTTFYTKEGIEIGSIKILSVVGSKAKVAFKMRDDALSLELACLKKPLYVS